MHRPETLTCYIQALKFVDVGMMDIARTSRLPASQKLCLGTEHWKSKKKNSTLIIFPLPSPKHIGRKKETASKNIYTSSASVQWNEFEIWKIMHSPYPQYYFSKQQNCFLSEIYAKKKKKKRQSQADTKHGKFPFRSFKAEKLEKIDQRILE